MDRLREFGLRENVSFGELSTMKVGGNARFLVYPKDYDEVKRCMVISKENKLPILLLGKGSNIICKDGGFSGVVVSTERLNKISVDGEILTAQSGVSIYDCAKFARENSLCGFEFAEGIPGSVGGMVYMNSGAYSLEASDIIVSCLVLEENGEIRKYEKSELDFGRRSSIFQKKFGIVLSASFKLSRGDSLEISKKMSEYHQKRADKQPLEYPSAGSTFKRPEGYFAAALIEKAGLKGLCFGDAEVSKKHAGFIINKGKASSKEVLLLIETVQKVVEDLFGVALEREVQVVGED